MDPSSRLSGINSQRGIIQPIPGGAPPANQGTHKWKNIGEKVKDVFNGVKGAFKNMSQQEKDSLIAAAAIVGIVALIIAVLTLVFGFAGLGVAMAVVAPLAFTAFIPLAGYKIARERRREKPTSGEIAAHQRRIKQIEVSREANRVNNAKMREKWLSAQPG